MKEIKSDVEPNVEETLGTELVDAIEACDIKISGVYSGNDEEKTKYAEMEFFSDAGEDFIFTIEFKNANEFVENFREYADNFDINEHVSMWIEAAANGSKGVPPAVELVEDAKGISAFLQDTADTIEKAFYGSTINKEQQKQASAFERLRTIPLQICEAEIDVLKKYLCKDLKSDLDFTTAIHTLISDAANLGKGEEKLLKENLKPKSTIERD